MNVFDALATPVAMALRGIHYALSHYLGLQASSGPAWGLSIVLLTISVRVILFPLFVKQIKSQRRMQELAPQIKALQARHKGDRETLNTELMKLYKDHNANPISGCLPLILQLPVFFALFRTINEFRPQNGGFQPKYGLSAQLLEQGAHAKIFGAPISAAFTSSPDLLHQLGGSSTTVRIVSLLMIILMGATTFWTQRQMMARAGAAADAQQQQIQKFMLYVLPLSFAVFGINFPVGVLLYWLTTNLWSMGQQAYVIKRMPPVVPGAAGVATGPTSPPEPPADSTPGPVGTGSLARWMGRRRQDPVPVPRAPKPAEAQTPTLSAEVEPATRTPAASGPPGGRRAAGSRKNKKRGRR